MNDLRIRKVKNHLMTALCGAGVLVAMLPLA